MYNKLIKKKESNLMKKILNAIANAYLTFVGFLDDMLGDWSGLLPDTMLRSFLLTCFIYPMAAFISWSANWVIVPFWWWWCALNTVQAIYLMFHY